MRQAGDALAKRVVDLPHPNSVAARQILVHRNDVHAVPRKRVQVERRGGGERLALARKHLDRGAAVEPDAAQKLDVKMPLAKRSPRRFAHKRERFGKDIVERGALSDPRLQRAGTLFEPLR